MSYKTFPNYLWFACSMRWEILEKLENSTVQKEMSLQSLRHSSVKWFIHFYKQKSYIWNSNTLSTSALYALFAGWIGLYTKSISWNGSTQIFPRMCFIYFIPGLYIIFKNIFCYTFFCTCECDINLVLLNFNYNCFVFFIIINLLFLWSFFCVVCYW